MTREPPDLHGLLAEQDGSVVQVKGTHLSAQVRGKVFAYTRKDGLVLKLPADRVNALAEAGTGSALVMGRRKMSEWVVVPAGAGTEALRPLVFEAAHFVAGT